MTTLPTLFMGLLAAFFDGPLDRGQLVPARRIIANPSGGSDFKSSMMPSRRLTDDTVLRRLAGAQSYQRGLDYFSHGHVESLEEADDCIRALEHMERETGLEPATSSLGKRSYFVH